MEVAESIFNSSNSITGELNGYLDEVDANLSFLGDYIARIDDGEFTRAYIVLTFYPENGSNRYNRLLIYKGLFNGNIISTVDCYVDRELIISIGDPSATDLNSTIETCVPYITNGFKFQDNEILSFSPYIGPVTAIEGNFFEKLKYNRIDHHRDFIEDYINQK